MGADRRLSRLRSLAEQACELSDALRDRADQEIRQAFQAMALRLPRLGVAPEQDRILAMALARDAARRVTGLSLFEEQVMVSLALEEGCVAEASTGSGKTLACVPAVAMAAAYGAGAHVVTVNGYLADRDARNMGPIYGLLGLSCACVVEGRPSDERRAAYAADVTYGTTAEFGFDWLRDNMVTSSPAARVQRGHHAAFVDEADSILIDDAMTPLIISGPSDGDVSDYTAFADAVATVRDADVDIDERARDVMLSPAGLARVESALGREIYADGSGTLVGMLNNALKARFLYLRDVQYVVENGEVLIVDRFTGRTMPGRRYAEGLHQAIEAKEHLKVQPESQTLATTTVQNYFRLYERLSGMTGTAMSADAELMSTYSTPVVRIPDHVPCQRRDLPDLVFSTSDARYRALADAVAGMHSKGRPVLIGTTSVESSDLVSRLLTQRNVPHAVLNAREHAREADIVAMAGRPGAVTVATDMAGRGTDIRLGGDPATVAQGLVTEANLAWEDVSAETRQAAMEAATARCAADAKTVIGLGGLCVMGTGRHDARRIDDQLRGRAGRQGDPGESRLWLSLEDDVIRRFAGEAAKRAAAMMPPDGAPLESPTLTRIIDDSQRRVEGILFASRKRTLDYDDITDRHRRITYAERDRVLSGEADVIAELEPTVSQVVRARMLPLDGDARKAWLEALMPWEGADVPQDVLSAVTARPQNPSRRARKAADDAAADAAIDWVVGEATERMRLLDDSAAEVSRQVLIHLIDSCWRAYLAETDYLRCAVGLRGMGMRDPMVEYAIEADDIFMRLVLDMYEKLIRTLTSIRTRLMKPGPNDIMVGEADADDNAGDARVTDVPAANATTRPEKPNPQDESDEQPHGSNVPKTTQEDDRTETEETASEDNEKGRA
jgi:preprotein translocase subunit SecA